MKNQRYIWVVLGQRLRHLRKEKLLTQEEMAERAGLNAKYYAQVERGQRNISIGSLNQIADGLGITLADLFRFPYQRPLTEEDEEIIALATHLILHGDNKSKRLLRALLKEIVNFRGRASSKA